MAGNENTRYRFVFHGRAGQFFVICLVNVLLTMVTCGIYLPWAFVKSRRYIYENMELNGARFQYHATGGALFGSFILLMFFFFAGTVACAAIQPELTFLPMIALVLLMPVLVVKGLRYQAMMTTLNNVRFGFRCRTGQAMWVLLGLPVLMMLAGLVVIVMFNKLLGMPSDITGLIIHMVVITLVILLTFGVIYGVNYGKWMQLLGNNARFGIHAFSITVSIKRCILTGVAAMLIIFPFLIVIGKVIAPAYMSIMLLFSTGGLTEATQADLLLQYHSEILMAYVLYFAGVMLVATFFVTALRNIFINGLQLENGIRFHSSITFINMLMQIVVIALATGFTLGLAYPWAKIRFIRYLANNTAVMGDLDALELTDSDEPLDQGFLAMLSRAMVPAMPFI